MNDTTFFLSESLFLFSAEAYTLLLEGIRQDNFVFSILFNLACLFVLVGINRPGAPKLLFAMCTIFLIWLSWRFYIIENVAVLPYSYVLGSLGLLLASLCMFATHQISNRAYLAEPWLATATIIYVCLLRPVIIWTGSGSFTLTPIGSLPIPTLILLLGFVLSHHVAYRTWLVGLSLGLMLLETTTLLIMEQASWQEGMVVTGLLAMLCATVKHKPFRSW